jgi:hypothetical protein
MRSLFNSNSLYSSERLEMEAKIEAMLKNAINIPYSSGKYILLIRMIEIMPMIVQRTPEYP